MHRVALIGTGNIAATHAAALAALDTVRIEAVMDLDPQRAQSFARKWNIGRTYDSLVALLDAGVADVAHVLVPPAQHFPVAREVLARGLHVLVEKPMATSDAECAALQEAAGQSLVLGVNHNAAFYPAHQALKAKLSAGEIGRIRHVSCTYNMPLRQLGAGQLGHWMFAEPKNLLLEQAVHPLSQICDLLGPVELVSAEAFPPRRVQQAEIHTRWHVVLRGQDCSAALHLAFGETFPLWEITVIGSDGVASAEYVRDTFDLRQGTKWLEMVDHYAATRRRGAGLKRQASLRLARSLVSTIGLSARQDPFYIGMRDSLRCFYSTLDPVRHALARQRAESARLVVRLCEEIVEKAGLPSVARLPATPMARAGEADVLVIGGTGFIGRKVVTELLAQGQRVAVMARNPANVPDMLADARIAVIRGDARNQAAIEEAIGTTRRVVNLAQGGDGDSWPDIERAVVGGARAVAGACLARKVERLVHVSSIAALDLGSPSEVVLGSTETTRQPERRAFYARAKALAEKQLLQAHREAGLPVCILRPGVVVGEGGVPFHTGLGSYNTEQHCLGWNRGDNPLPFVLVEDVAAAIVLALASEQAVGRCYNLVGDVRLSAREYIEELAKALGRPLVFHPQSPHKIAAIEVGKWVVKQAIGRRDAPFPHLIDIQSRGMRAQFDCSDAKRDLGWSPVADREEFVRRGIRTYAA